MISCEYKFESKIEAVVKNLTEETSISTIWAEENENYKKLAELATTKDLLHLAENENPYVRCYSFIALRDRDYPKIKQLCLKNQNDTQTVNTNNGACLKGDMRMNVMLYLSLDPEYHKSKFGFSQDEFDRFSFKNQ